MKSRKLANGQTAYYWIPQERDKEKGFPLDNTPLGHDYGTACIRCDGDPNDDEDKGLNGFLDDWRASFGSPKDLDLSPAFGTIDWWVERYQRTDAFTQKVSDRTKPEYKRLLKKFCDIPTKDGGRLGALPVKSLTPAAIDKVYIILRGGQDGTLFRRANYTIDIAKKAWAVVQRLYPDRFHVSNPFKGLTRVRVTTPVKEATRDEAYAFSKAIFEYGHPHLAVVPLICFEWLQRPENIIAGYFTWDNYRPTEHPHKVKIVHHKTGQEIWHPLDDPDVEGNDRRFYSEIEDFLEGLERTEGPVVLTTGKRGPRKLYGYHYALEIARKARRAATLSEHITFTACRHGGMTELGDSELTEQQTMSLSAHKTPSAARGYVKKTEIQRLKATRKRRAWVIENRE